MFGPNCQGWPQCYMTTQSWSLCWEPSCAKLCSSHVVTLASTVWGRGYSWQKDESCLFFRKYVWLLGLSFCELGTFCTLILLKPLILIQPGCVGALVFHGKPEWNQEEDKHLKYFKFSLRELGTLINFGYFFFLW